MRLLVYLGVTIAAFVALSGFNHPLSTYLKSIRSEVAADQRQLQLVQIDARLAMFRTRMVALLRDNPSFARVRIALIHEGITAHGTSELQWNIDGALSAPGHAVGDMVYNRPLSEWSQFLGTLLEGRCVYVAIDDLKDKTARFRLDSLTIKAFLGCPILTKKHQLLGGIFASWDRTDDVPDDLAQSEESLMRAADLIAHELKADSERQ